MDVVSQAVGPEGKIDIKVEGGKIVISFIHVHASGQVSISASEDLRYFLEILKPKLPAWAQLGIGIAEGALP